MANKTIYGCYNSGAVTFAGEACDSGDYTGCYVASGEHAGQIAVTISEYNCDDTYYGCINTSTGKFQLVIPDDCCNIGEACSHCSETPFAIIAVFTGLASCGSDCVKDGSFWYSCSSPPNGIYILYQTGNPCIWYNAFSGTICAAFLTEQGCKDTTDATFGIKVSRFLGSVRVELAGANVGRFWGSFVPTDGCVGGGCSNEYDCTDLIYGSAGGSVIITG